MAYAEQSLSGHIFDSATRSALYGHTGSGYHPSQLRHL